MLNVPEVTDCVQVDQNLHVKLFCKGAPLPLPQWFRHCPERNIDGKWIKEQILDSLKTCGFRVSAIVSDNHSVNASAYKLLLKESSHLDDHLFTQYDYQKIYWLHDAVHLIKNVRNNLLNHKRFIFPAFEYDGFEDPISFKGGQISWKLFHNVFEKDSLLEANLRKAPKITHKVLHPGNCKQKVPVILAILHGLHQQLLLVIFMRKK